MENTKEFFETVYENTNEKVKIFLMKKCKSISDVNDIFQEIYLEFYRVLDHKGRDYVKNEEALIMHIAKKKIHRFYRTWNRIPDCISYEDEMDYEDENPDGQVELDEQLISDELISRLRCKLESKSDEIQKIFYMHYTMELTFVEIAEIMSVKESTVKSRVYRTLAELREEYQGGIS